MTQIFAISNQKGGVGKTTTAINLAASLARLQQQVLLVDSDPQGNATTGSGINKTSVEYALTEALLQKTDAHRCIQPTTGGYDVLPANNDLIFAEIELMQQTNKEQRLRDILHSIPKKYDFILIDCPPALSLLTLNAMVASHGIIIPMQCEYFALEGLTSLLHTLEQLQTKIHVTAKILGIVCTMFDRRSRLALDVSAQLHAHFPNLIFQTVIPRNVRLAEAPSHGLPALLYDQHSSGACAYLDLAQEVLCRIKNNPDNS